MENKAKICAYGNHRLLRFTVANRENSRLTACNRFVSKAIARSEQNEYIIDGTRYSLVTSLQDYDVVLCPDRTYGKIDRRTMKFLGAY